jgi:hypothetical protein
MKVMVPLLKNGRMMISRLQSKLPLLAMTQAMLLVLVLALLMLILQPATRVHCRLTALGGSSTTMRPTSTVVACAAGAVAARDVLQTVIA